MNALLNEQTVKYLQREAYTEARQARLVRAARAELRARRAVRSARLAADRAVVTVVAAVR
jgi:hypothetical protein